MPSFLALATLAASLSAGGAVFMRPGIYFGTTEVGEAPLSTGIAWGSATQLSQVGHNGNLLRHSAQHDHKLQAWGWHEHNGEDYGRQFIGDSQNNLNLTMVWTKQQQTAVLCSPWLLTVNGTTASSAKKRKAADRAISFFVYASAPEGELYVKEAAGSDGAAETDAVAVISGLVSSSSASSKGGFGLIARAASSRPQKSRSSSSGKGGIAARISAGPDRAKGAIARHLSADKEAPASTSVEPFVSRRWTSVGIKLPADDAWQVEELLKRELKRSASDIHAATFEAQKAMTKELKESSRPAINDDGSEVQGEMLVPEEVKAKAERLAHYATLPAIPSLLSSGARDGGNLAVMQVVLVPPFKLELVFLQQDCFAAAPAPAPGATVGLEGDAEEEDGEEDDELEDDDARAAKLKKKKESAANPFGTAAKSPVRRIKGATWSLLRSSLIPPQQQQGAEAETETGEEQARQRQRQYREELCTSLGLCLSQNETATAATVGDEDIDSTVVASRAIANLVGSTTHFYGRQLVSDTAYPLDDNTKNNEDPSRDAKLSEPYHLITGVPSRSFFPRGFLWDEGFHQLVASQYKPLQLTTRVVASWLRTMDKDGWIAREQILGGEARSRVPERFRVQYRDIANPPAMMLPLFAMASDAFCRGPAATAAREGQKEEIAVAIDASGEAVSAVPFSSSSFLTAGVRAFCERRANETCRYSCLRPEEAAFLPFASPVLRPSEKGENEGKEKSAAQSGGSLLSSVWRKIKSIGSGEGDDDEDDDQLSSSAGDDVIAEETNAIERFLSPADQDPQHHQQSQQYRQEHRLLAFYRAAYPLLRRHYRWYLRTQAGRKKGSFRWRGVTNADHNFASGLDDYPRGEVPTLHDENSDLLSWMAFYAETLADLGALVEADQGDIQRYRKHAQRAIERLKAVHWDDESRVFCDIAARIDREALARQRADPRRQLPLPFLMGKQCHVGYATILPLLLRQLDPLTSAEDRTRLSAMLDVLEDEKHMWSPFGLRSLAKSSPYFGTGENYWRGSVWINLNYLAVASLKHYASSLRGREGGGEDVQLPMLQGRLSSLSERLKEAVVGNIVKQYRETGFLWENYDSNSGKGRGTHPFTGWTALVSLMVAGRFPV